MDRATAGRKREFAQYARCVGIEGLEVMSANWIEHAFAPHMHDFYAVSLNYHGRGAFECRGELHDASPGFCNLIAPGERHTGRAAAGNGWAYRNLYIETPLMARLLQEIDWPGPLPVAFRASLAKDAVLAARLDRAFASMISSNSRLQNETLLLSVVARLTTTHFERAHTLAGVGQERSAITRTREWLDAHSERNVSIGSLAQLAGLSAYHLVRVFHRQVGVPPHRYQMIVRVHRARNLLALGASPSEVAYRTGFCDQSHLTRCFRKTLGVTPSRYAAGHMKGTQQPARMCLTGSSRQRPG